MGKGFFKWGLCRFRMVSQSSPQRNLKFAPPPAPYWNHTPYAKLSQWKRRVELGRSLKIANVAWKLLALSHT